MRRRSGVTLSAFVTGTGMRACNKPAERQARVPDRIFAHHAVQAGFNSTISFGRDPRTEGRSRLCGV